MAVTLRLSRTGAKKVPFYRIVATDTRNPRDGKFIDQIGTYDPTKNPAVVNFKDDRLDYWMSHGAQTSEVVGQLIRRHKVKTQASK